MQLSVFDLFKIGVGPSSSHTVGPMVAGLRFLQQCQSLKLIDHIARVRVDLYGSLAMTGKGHATDRAVLMGLIGHHPSTIDPTIIDPIYESIETQHSINFGGVKKLPFILQNDLVFNFVFKPVHSNTMEFRVFDANGAELLMESYYSVGGGFVMSDDEIAQGDSHNAINANNRVPNEFTNGAQLVKLAEQKGLTIAELIMENELTWRTEAEINDGIDRIWAVMDNCIRAGIQNEGILPGGLNVKRRAHQIVKNLKAEQEALLMEHGKGADPTALSKLPMKTMDWVNVFALAVNEENAAGGRVVTAPTNGAAGVIPAVVAYYLRFVKGANMAGVREMFLTAAAIGMLYKKNASISAAEVGCQGEVGVACSMAAAALCAVLGGNIHQVENAAEIGMEHNLGLTCDPIKGLVQVPCIERNTMGAIKAINAARLALHGDGEHVVSLDQVIKTMNETGKDMMSKYKETSEGGLATSVALPEC